MYRMGVIKILCRLTFYGWLFPVLCTSCVGYRVFQVDVLEPAGVTLGKDKKIGFWDRNIRPQCDSSFLLNRYPGISSDELSYVFYSALQEALGESETDSLQSIVGKEKRYVPDQDIPAPVASVTLMEIGRRFGMDYIVSLEKIGYRVDRPEKYVKFDLFLRLYDCGQGEVLDSVLYEYDLKEALVNEYELTEYVNGMIGEQGTEYARRLKPYWLAVDRRIYNGGRVLKMGDVFFQHHDWEQAKRLWEAATRLTFRQAIRGYLNLAWLYEMEGDFFMAGQMLQKGIDIAEEKGLDNADTDYLKMYMKVIVKRIKDKALLDSQI